MEKDIKETQPNMGIAEDGRQVAMGGSVIIREARRFPSSCCYPPR